MPDVSVIFPVEGRDDSRAKGRQAPRTTPDALNVRGSNDKNGRIGAGGTRAGSSKWCPDQLASGPVRQLAHTVYDDRHVDYSELAVPVVEYSEDGQTMDTAYGCVHDGASNAYSIDGGTSVIVRSASGVLVTSFPIALASGQSCRAIYVDAAQRVYVGVSSGGAQADARLFCYSKDPIKGYMRVWEFDAGGYVVAIKAYGTGALVLGVNEVGDDELDGLAGAGRAWMMQLALAEGDVVPVETFRRSAVAPIRALAVSPDGKVATCTDQRSHRGYRQADPVNGPCLERDQATWWFDQLDNFDQRRWCFFDPRTLGLEDGDAVLSWPDAYGSAREFLFIPGVVNVPAFTRRLDMESTGDTADGDTLTVVFDDEAVTEVYTLKNTPAAIGDVQRDGASAITTQRNLASAVIGINQSGASSPPYFPGTDPSGALVVDPDPAGFSTNDPLASCRLTKVACRVTCAGTLDFDDGLKTHTLMSAQTVTLTPPTFIDSPVGGGPCVRFNGQSDRLETLANQSLIRAEADQHHSMIPGYGSGSSPTQSAGFLLTMVAKLYPSERPGALFGQAGVFWKRSIVTDYEYPNPGTADGITKGKLTFFERRSTDTGTAIRRVTTDYYDPTGATQYSPLTLITILSDPTNDVYELRVNGVLIETGSPEVNNSLGPTTLGQALTQFSFTSGFARFDLYGLLVLRDFGGQVATADEIRRIEGAFAWEHGIRLYLPDALAAATATASGVTITSGAAHGLVDGDTVRFGSLGSGLPPNLFLDETYWAVNTTPTTLEVSTTQGGPSIDTGGVGAITFEVYATHLHFLEPPAENGMPRGTWHQSRRALSPYPSVARYDKLTGDLSYIIASEDRFVVNEPTYGGMGVGVAWSTDGELLYSVGNPADITDDATTIRAFVDQQTTFSIDPVDGAWTYPFPNSADHFNNGARLELAVDAFDNLYVPFANDGFDGDLTHFLFWMFARDGTLELAVPHDFGAGAHFGGNAISVDPSVPDFTGNVPPITRAERVALACRRDPGQNRTMLGVRIVDTTETNRGRKHVITALCEGGIYVVETTGKTAIVDTGVQALSASARYCHAASVFGQTIFLDGIAGKLYDARTGVLDDWKAQGQGRVPRHGRIVEIFAGAAVVAGLPDAHDWEMSARPGISNWDYAPGVLLPNQAWSGSLGGPGRLPDVITGIIPAFDDLAFWLCDHSVYRMTGDPASPGCRFDPLSEVIGGAFGRAWCVGPGGTPFFWAQQGGIFAIEGGTKITPVVARRLDRVLQSIDHSRFFVRMAWSKRYDGIDIMLCPFQGVSEIPQTYFWDRALNAIWVDERGSADRTVTDILVFDGDEPDDRRTLLARRDGYVAFVDEDADDDDGVPIQSRVVMGPYFLDERFETKVSRLMVLLEQQQGAAQVRLRVSDNPSEVGPVVATYTVGPGLTPYLSARQRGGYVWIEIASTERWAFEAVTIAMHTGSYRRRRA